MTRYRTQLPQLAGNIFLSDGGMETTMIFHQGIDLPYFAAFDLLRTQQGEQIVLDYFRRYADIAHKNSLGFILESPTWRASLNWGQLMGYSEIALHNINTQAIELLQRVRDEFENESTPIVISGCIGPRDDGYDPKHFMSIEQARQYHSQQINTFANTEADMVTALTMTYSNEAIGIVLAAQQAHIPVVISFTVETDGKLPNGETLQQAIQQVDQATANGPVYYMINCAHPLHFEKLLKQDDEYLQRIHGIRANASCKSHAELDEASELDEGNPHQLGQQYHSIKQLMPQINVMGGCCGTDHRHLEQICAQVKQA